MAEVRTHETFLAAPELCRIFIPQYPGTHDIKDLGRFAISTIYKYTPGEVIYPDQKTINERHLAVDLGQWFKLWSFNPHYDYVLIMGDPLIQVSAAFVLGNMFRSVTYLRYDNRESRYWAFRVGFIPSLSNL